MARAERQLVTFPIFERLSVDNYLLYPGKPDSPGLHLHLTPGPWIVLGVNGLGKTTLLLIFKHLLAGPVRMRPAGFTGERSDLLAVDSRTFAVRVGDGAQTATASANVRFGSTLMSVTRRLGDLSLVEATWTDGSTISKLASEADYRTSLANAMGVAQFEDALRAIERIVFYLETRDPLIWDLSAQFELFRAILTPSISSELRRLEGAIVSADSFARNLNATLYKLVSRREKQRQKHARSAETLALLAKTTAELEAAEDQELELRGELETIQEKRSDLRIEVKRVSRAADNTAREYEEVKFEALRHAFAGVGPNEQYVLLKIIADRICAACGSRADEKAEELERQHQENRCLICGAHRAEDSKVSSTASATHAKAMEVYGRLQTVRVTREQLEQKFNEAERDCEIAENRLDAGRKLVDAKRREIRKLRAKLPSDTQRELARQEDDIERLRGEVLEARRERDQAEDEITALLAELKAAAEGIREQLEATFHGRAREFFAEEVRLVYAPRRDRIGQGGRIFEFPAFEVEMTSGATGGEFVRRRPEQVSYSQREYIDIIFRMSIIETMGGGGASLIVDGPEGALDAVFAERAGHLFAGLTTRTPAAAVLACNIVEGAFIPCSLAAYKSEEERRTRVVNLLDIAEPTAALRELWAEYHAAVNLILQKECI